MNSLDTRIQQALRAQAERLTERDLTPMLPPSGSQPRSGWSLPILAAAAVALLVAGGTIAVRAATGPAHHGPAHHGPAAGPSRTQSASNGPTPTSLAPTPSRTEPGSTAPTGTAAPTLAGPLPTPTPSGQPSPQPTLGLPAGYVPLWPIDASGHGQPAGNAPATALAFTRQYLGFAEITTVTSSRYDDRGAHIGVGYRNPAGQLATAAVLHLLQYPGNGPWEVVGSDDTTLTLEQPAYGSSVSSPMTVGGRITGVDENIRVMLRSQAHGVLGTEVGVPAGGQAAPWHTTVSFSGDGVWTVVAMTGGHVQSVERFAIQGVRA